MDFKKIRGMAVVCIAVLILVYAGFFVVSRQVDSSGGLVTEMALYGEISDTLQTQGFAIRNEEVIRQDYSGVLNYQVANGTRVAQGGVIAQIFRNESDATAWNRIDRLEREMESLSDLTQPIDYYASTPAAVGVQIYGSLGGILTDVQRNDFSAVQNRKSELLSALSRKQVVAGEESAEDYAQRVAELKTEQDGLKARAGQPIGTLEAPRAGYFIGSTDGFEDVMDGGTGLNVEDVLEITPAQVDQMLRQEAGEGSLSTIGKICLDFKWYLVCNLDDASMIKFEGVEDVTLDIPFASSETIPARVVAKTNRDPDTGLTAVVLECTYMDEDIATVRNEAVQINVHTYKGVLVNEKALRFCDVSYTETDENGNTVEKVRENVKGVYVVYGGRLRFVQVLTEKNINGYAVCKYQLSDEELQNLVTDRTVGLYDEVVVGRVDLYDGKIIK